MATPTAAGAGSKVHPSKAAASRAVKSQKVGGAASANPFATGHASVAPALKRSVNRKVTVSQPKPLKAPGGAPIIGRTPGHQPAPAPNAIDAGALFKGGAKLGVTHVKNNWAVPTLLLLTFLLVAAAKIKATKGSTIASLDIPKALFGGFVVALILLVVNQWNSRIATGFAALIFVSALLEFGKPFFDTLIPKGKTQIDPSTGQLQTGLAYDQTTPTGKPTSTNIHDNTGHGTQLS